MIIRRYLFREVLLSFAAVMGVLLLIFVSNRFVRYLAQATTGKISSELIFELLALQVVTHLGVLLPLALFISILLALGRLYRDSEVVAMTAAGVGLGGLAGHIFLLSVGFAMVAVGLSLYLSPRAASVKEAVYAQARNDAEVSGVVPGQFNTFDGDQIAYVEDMSPDGTMQNVFVQVRRGGELELLLALRAHRRSTEGGHGDGDSQDEDGDYIVLEDGYRYRGEPGTVDYVVTRFRTHAVRIEQAAGVDRYRKLEAWPTRRLLDSSGPEPNAEVQRRLSHPLSVLLLALLAVPLARTTQQHGKYAKLFLGVLVYFVYINAMSVTLKLVERGELSAAVGSWPVHGAVAALVAVLLFFQSSSAWRLLAALRGRRSGP